MMLNKVCSKLFRVVEQGVHCGCTGGAQGACVPTVFSERELNNHHKGKFDLHAIVHLQLLEPNTVPFVGFSSCFLNEIAFKKGTV